MLFAPRLFPGQHEGRVWVPKPHAPEGLLFEAPATAPSTAPATAEDLEGARDGVRLGAWRLRLRRMAADGGAADGGAADGGAADGGAAEGGAAEGGVPERGSALQPPEIAACVGNEPAALWRLAEGRLSYTLPGRTHYAVGGSATPQLEAFDGLRGEVWAGLLAAFPQIVCAGEPSGGPVRVELECVRGT